MIQIKYEQLYIGIAVLVALVIAVMLVIMIIKVIRLLNKLDNILTYSEDKIKNTINNVSDITDNTNKLTAVVKDATGGIVGGVGELATSVKSSSQTILDSTSILTDLILTAIKIIRKKIV